MGCRKQREASAEACTSPRCRAAFVLSRALGLRLLPLVHPQAQLLETPCKEAVLKACVGPISASAAAPSVPGNSKTSFQCIHSVRGVLILTLPPHASLCLELGVFLPLFGDFLARKPFYEKCLIIAARKIISNNLL